MGANDGLLVENAVYVLLDSLKEKLRENYFELILLFRKITLFTTIGQIVDFQATPPSMLINQLQETKTRNLHFLFHCMTH
jgi:hypothetical protein